MRDLHNSVEVFSTIVAQAISATTSGSAVDAAGYDGAELIISAGDFAFTTTNKVDVKLQAGDKSDSSDMADIDAMYLLGANISLNNAADKQKSFRQGYIGDKRYLRAVFTVGGTVSAPMSATIVLRPIHMPAANQDAGN